MPEISNLYNVPGNEAELNAWSFAHAADHRDIARRIREISGQELTEYSLDPVPILNPQAWVYQHQIMHAQMNSFLGLPSLNLSDLDIKSPESLSGWITANATEHRQAWEAIQLAQAASTPSVIAATFRDVQSTQASASPYNSVNFENRFFGPAADNRYIVACFGYPGSAGPFLAAVDSVTIGGQPATILATGFPVAMAIAHVPVGVTGSVAATFTRPAYGVSAMVFSVTGLAAPGATQVVQTSDAAPASFNVSANGAVIGIGVTGGTAGRAVSWSGINQQYFLNYGPSNNYYASAASKNFPSASPGLSVSCIYSGPLGSRNIFALFNPT